MDGGRLQAEFPENRSEISELFTNPKEAENAACDLAKGLGLALHDVGVPPGPDTVLGEVRENVFDISSVLERFEIREKKKEAFSEEDGFPAAASGSDFPFTEQTVSGKRTDSRSLFARRFDAATVAAGKNREKASTEEAPGSDSAEGSMQSLKQEVHEENLQKLARMSAQEIAEYQKKIVQELGTH